MIHQKCLYCGKYFDARLSDVKRGRSKYCSLSCAAKINNNVVAHKTGIFVFCAYCGREVYRQLK